jgi:capsular polysaccharide transport system ATP-binding protein
MIVFDNVTKVYPTRSGVHHVLNNVSFEVARGQAVGIMGRNGAGKSTLTKLIGGCERPTSGRIERTMSVSWPLGLAGGFQYSLTGADNVRFIARIYGFSTDSLLEFVDDFAELGKYLRMPVKTYSSGMRARLTFAISLALEFDCYLVDEITAVGDFRFQQRCEQALYERRERGTLIMVTHAVQTLRTFCNRGAVLHDGQLTFYDDIDEVIAVYQALMQ